MRIRSLLSLIPVCLVVACSAPDGTDVETEAPFSDAVSTVEYATPRNGSGHWKQEWNLMIASALDKHGTLLVPGIASVQRDMNQLCASYSSSTREVQKAMWALVFAEIARYESTEYDINGSYAEANQCLDWDKLPPEYAVWPGGERCRDRLADFRKRQEAGKGRMGVASAYCPDGPRGCQERDGRYYSSVQRFSEGLLSMSADDELHYPGCKGIKDQVTDPNANLTCGVAVMNTLASYDAVKNPRGPLGKSPIPSEFKLFPPSPAPGTLPWMYWSVMTSRAGEIRSNFASHAPKSWRCGK